MEFIVITPERLEQLITESVERAIKRSAMSLAAQPVTSNDADIIDIAAVAELLNVSVSTVHNYKSSAPSRFTG